MLGTMLKLTVNTDREWQFVTFQTYWIMTGVCAEPFRIVVLGHKLLLCSPAKFTVRWSKFG
jgi:hypothetical protein